MCSTSGTRKRVGSQGTRVHGQRDQDPRTGRNHTRPGRQLQVGGIAVQPAYVHMRTEAMKFSPEATQEKTGIHPDIVREEARRFAAAKKAVVASGFASAKMLNGIYTQWAQILMCALTGHGGETGRLLEPLLPRGV